MGIDNREGRGRAKDFQTERVQVRYSVAFLLAWYRTKWEWCTKSPHPYSFYSRMFQNMQNRRLNTYMRVSAWHDDCRIFWVKLCFKLFFFFFWLIYFTFPIRGHCLFNCNISTNRHTRWEAMRVHYDIWTDSCIAKWHVFLRNNQSTHPCRKENISIHKQQTTSRADAHHQIFFSVFLLLSFSWITFYPDSLPWPVLTTCRLEDSPCDRTGKISIPLHNAPSDLWVSKLGKKALDTVFRGNLKLLTSQTGTSQVRSSF